MQPRSTWSSDSYAIAAELARMPGVAERLIELHVADETGRHCRECTYWQQPRPMWPCSIRSTAERALRLRTGSTAPASAPDADESR